MIDGGVTGLILAGGRGARMDGVDKGLQVLDGRPLVAHAIARLAPQVDAIVVSANRHRERYAAFGHPVVPDAFGDHAGPLAGIHAGLGACATAWMLVVPCDAPYFPTDLGAHLAAALDDADVDVAIAVTPVRVHPVFCMLRTRVADALLAHLDAGGRSVRRWAESMRGRQVSFDDEDAFRNINTIDELHAAARPAR